MPAEEDHFEGVWDQSPKLLGEIRGFATRSMISGLGNKAVIWRYSNASLKLPAFDGPPGCKGRPIMSERLGKRKASKAHGNVRRDCSCHI